jgi:tRNA A37 threonylcarbamoyladenosine synthetase subunit TsaC/SUA5/YrdC
LGCALTATSANIAGEEPITDPDAVRDRFGDHLRWIVDDGVLQGGEPSTVVAWEPVPDSAGASSAAGRIVVLRPGAFVSAATAAPAGSSAPHR